MSLSERLAELAEKVEVLEERHMDFDDLTTENSYLRAENQWLRGFLDDFGIDIEANFSVADVMAIEKALQTVKA